MNFRFKYLAYFCIVFAVVIINSSCNKKWKKPTDVYFEFQLNSNSNNGLIKFIEGSINITKINFNGERSQKVKNINQEQNFSNSQFVQFNLNPTSSGIKFNIPQGSYNNINFDFDVIENQTASSIIINGTYINSAGTDTNIVQLKLLENQTLSFTATNSNGNNDINLIKDKSSTVSMILNPNYWFEPINAIMLDTSDVNITENIIIISKDENVSIYNLIINRINSGNEAIFR